MKIGYMRVSTDDQDTALQEAALVKYGCDKIYSDKVSGTTTTRIGLDLALLALKPGDTFVVWKLDRLGRTVRQLKDSVEDFERKGITFTSLTEMIDTSTAQGRLFFHMLAAFAEFEREIIKQRSSAGVAAAKAKGVHCGRPRGKPHPLTTEIVNLHQFLSIREIAKIKKLTHSKVHRIIQAALLNQTAVS